MIRLFYNYYEDKNPLRKPEIDLCFQKNLMNPHINVIIIESQTKLTYNNFFERINQLAEPNDISVICNSDIYLDETIKLAHHMLPNQIYALSRWDVIKTGEAIFSNRKDSQDTWIVKGTVKNVSGDFTLGVRGCDNRIAWEFNKSGYKVSNPSKSIKTYHVHNSNIRNYSNRDVVPEPYMIVEPGFL